MSSIAKLAHYPRLFLLLCVGVALILFGCRPSVEVNEETVASAAPPAVRTTGNSMQTSPVVSDAEETSKFVPRWVKDAVFYQIFPERFRNGDPTNDPTRESLESPDVPPNWRITPWTSDWYARADWERQLGGGFYDQGVFHRRYGGDLQGVLDRLDYLEELGVNAIYFNPVFYARSLHKYDGASMHHVDPHFGPDPVGDFRQLAKETSDPKTWQWTAADKLFLELVRQIHDRGMHVIIDGVFNHTGRDFFAFADLLENQADSLYQDWYIVQHFDNPGTPHNEFRYKSWWGFESLPEFSDNQSQQDLHAGPKRYVFDITRRWMDPDGDGDPEDGIDGWRLDVANEVPAGFWRDWNTLVRQLNPEAYTVGEFWGNAREHLVEGRFSGTMNYHGFAYLVKGFVIDGKLTPHDFGQQLVERLEEYPLPMRFAMQNLIDSHDTDRVASMIVNAGGKNYRQPNRFDYDVSEVVSPRHSSEYEVRSPVGREQAVQCLVALMQMTFVGPPMIYYGTEAGMWGADDPCNRQPMVWRDLDFEPQASDPLGRERSPDELRFDEELFDYYRRVVKLRRENPTLRRGTFEVVVADDEAKCFVFRRELEDSVMFVAINRGEAPYQLELPCREDRILATLFSTSEDGDSLSIEQQSDRAILTLPPLEGVVFSEQSREK